MLEMEKEKEKMELISGELQNELRQIRAELELTTNTMREVEQESERLNEQQNSLQSLLTVSKCTAITASCE